jgi:hypothetical protein
MHGACPQHQYQPAFENLVFVSSNFKSLQPQPLHCCSADTVTDIDIGTLLLTSQSKLNQAGIGKACQAKQVFSTLMKQTIANWRSKAACPPGLSVRI